MTRHLHSTQTRGTELCDACPGIILSTTPCTTHMLSGRNYHYHFGGCCILHTTWCGKIKKDGWECHPVVPTQTYIKKCPIVCQDCLGLGLGLGEWFDNLATARSDVLRANV